MDSEVQSVFTILYHHKRWWPEPSLKRATNVSDCHGAINRLLQCLKGTHISICTRNANGFREYRLVRHPRDSSKTRVSMKPLTVPVQLPLVGGMPLEPVTDKREGS